jgi:hypothetical protein
MQWVTRDKPVVDRVACPWLIKKFVDPQAEFVYVPAEQVRAVAEREGAIPYDIPDVELGHHGPACSFEAIVAKHKIEDPAVKLLAKVVRGADTEDRTYTPQSEGLRAISRGWHLLDWPTPKRLEVGMQLYDALYAWCQREVGG